MTLNSPIDAAIRLITLAGLALLAGCWNSSSGGRGTDSEGDPLPPTFAKSYGGDFNDGSLSGIPTTDGGYALMGGYRYAYSQYTDGDLRVGEDFFGFQPWFIKLDAWGDIEWQRALTSRSSFGGALPGDIRELRAEATSDGGFCLTGAVSGADGDPGDIYVGRLDSGLNVLWETRFDSGGWAGLTLIAAGAQGPSVNDTPIATVESGSGCIIVALSTGNVDGALRNGQVVAGEGTVLDVSSLVIARVTEAGPQWIRRHTDPFIGVLEVIATENGGALLGYLDGRYSNRLRSLRLDSGGARTAFDTYSSEPDGWRRIALATAGSGILTAKYDQFDRSAWLTRIDANGSERWSTEIELNNPIARDRFESNAIFYDCDVGGECFALVFTATTLLRYRFSDGALASIHPLGLPGTIIDVLQTAPRQYRVLARDSGEHIVASFDFTTGFAPLSQTRDTAVRGRYDGRVHQSGQFWIVRGFDSDRLCVTADSGGDGRCMDAPTEARVTGMVELQEGTFAVSLLERLYLNSGEIPNAAARTTLLLREGQIAGELSYRWDGAIAAPRAMVARPGGGISVLLEDSSSSFADTPRYAIVYLRGDGTIDPAAPARTLLTAETRWDPDWLKLINTAGGGTAALFGLDQSSTNDFRSRIIRMDGSASVTAHTAYTAMLEDFDATADGGLVAVSGWSYPIPNLAAVLRLDPAGNVLFERGYRLQHDQHFGLASRHIVTLPDDGFAIARTTRGLMNSGFVPYDEIGGPSRLPLPVGEHNVTLMRMQADGTPEWLTIHGGLYHEKAAGLARAPGGGFLLSARSDSVGASASDDAWLLRLGPDGRVAPGCNAELATLAGDVLDVVTSNAMQLDRETWRPTPVRVSHLPTTLPLANIEVIRDETSDFVLTEPPIVVARQCSGFAAPNAPLPPTDLRRLTVRQAGSITGLVRSVPSGIACGGVGPQFCAQDYAVGNLVTLIVDEADSARFRGFGAGNCSEILQDPARCIVDMAFNQDIDVFFEPADGSTATLTIAVSGRGQVDASRPSPVGIRCRQDPGSDCSESYLLGQQISLDVFADIDEQFLGWAGNCSEWGGAGSIVVDMDYDKACTALFSGTPLPAQFTLTTAVSVDFFVGAGGGRIISEPAGIDCEATGSVCSLSFDAGTVVTLRTAPTQFGNIFQRWTSTDPTSPCAGATTTAVQITMDRARDCTAEYLSPG